MRTSELSVSSRPVSFAPSWVLQVSASVSRSAFYNGNNAGYPVRIRNAVMPVSSWQGACPSRGSVNSSCCYFSGHVSVACSSLTLPLSSPCSWPPFSASPHFLSYRNSSRWSSFLELAKLRKSTRLSKQWWVSAVGRHCGVMLGIGRPPSAPLSQGRPEDIYIHVQKEYCRELGNNG